MNIVINKSIQKLFDLKRSVALAVLITSMTVGLGACSSDNDENVSNANAPTTANTSSAPAKGDPASPLKDLKSAGKNTAFSIDIINGQPIPKSGPVTVTGQEITMGGWAVDQQAQAAAGGVYVSIDGKKDVPTMYGAERKDVADVNKNPRYLKSGFAASILTSTIDKGRHTLTLKILTADQKGYYEPDQKVEIDVK